MERLDKYIPKEYLALKINYCRKQLEELPEIKRSEILVAGKPRCCISANSHRYLLDSPKGKEFLQLCLERDRLNRELELYEAVWHAHFRGDTSGFEPHRVIRSMKVSDNSQVILNKAFFDNLKNDDNDKYQKYPSNFFDGIYYRSAAERDIAEYYTDIGIPFKYEPKIWIAGLNNPINPDFVLYIRELDTCKFHEHLGMKSSVDYLRDTKIKYINYTNAGLIPGTDILFTYDTDDMPFDIRGLEVKLNSAVFITSLCKMYIS